MTTAQSPLRVLKAQADRIAMNLKRAERGESTEGIFPEKVAEARQRGSIKVGIVMDDKIVTIEMPWSKIEGTSEVALSEYILDQMRESRDTAH